jgi:PAS domain S-box-containing protein
MTTDNEFNFSIDVNEYGIQFNDIFKIEDIQQMQDLFSDATGVASLITNPEGIPITKQSNFCRFCNIVRSTEKGLTNCIQSDTLNCSTISSDMQLRPCLSAGLWDTGVKISVNGIHIANWLIGQVRNDEINMQKIIDYGVEIGANKDEYLDALKQVPVMSTDQFQKIIKMMFVITNELSEKAYSNLQLKKQISESEKINELLQKNEKSISITLQSIGDGVISTDRNGNIVNMNPIAENMCGWKLSDAYGKPLTDIFNIINSNTRMTVENPVNKVIEKGKIIGLSNHTVLISRDGAEYHIADSAAPIKNNDGFITGVVLVFSDVTEKFKAEEKLRESERSKSVLLSNLPGIAYRCKYDRQRTMEFISEGFTPLTGYLTDDIINNHALSFNDLILPEYHEYLWKVWEKAVQHHETVQVEYRILTADHHEKWVWEQGIPIYNNKGVVEALEGLIIDITERKNVEATLQNERLLLRTLIDNIPDAIYAKDLDGRKTLANKAEVELLGEKTESEVLGKFDHDYYPKEFADNFLADDLLVTRTGIPDYNREGFIIDRRGKKNWLLSSKLPLRDKDGRITGVMGIGRNITARKESEEALKKSESFLRETQVIAKLGTYSLDIINNNWTSSEVLDSIFGIPSDFDRSFNGWVSIIHPEWQETMNDYVLNTVFGKKKNFDKRYKIIRREDKEERWVHGLGELVFDKEHLPISLIGTIQDITERVNDENALRESEEKYRNIFDNLQDVFYRVDMDGILTEVSASIEYFAGYQRDEIIGRSIEILYVRTNDRQIAFESLIKNKHVRDYEIELKTKSGVIRHASLNAKLIYDSNGKPDHIDGFIRDITIRKQAENAMRESEKKFHDYIEFAPHGVFVSDASGKYIEVNTAASDITGYSKDELMSMNQTDLISQESIESFVNHFNAARMSGFASNEFAIIRKNRSKGYVAVDTVKLSKHLYLGFVIDITLRKETAEALKHSEELHRSILTASPDAIVVVDMDGQIRMISPAALTLYGYKNSDQLLGHNMFDFLALEDKDRAISNSLLMFNGYLGSIEYSIIREDGSTFFAEVNGDIIWDSDQPNGMVFIIRDISDRKKAENALRSSQVELKKFASHLQNVREEEKIQLAREIHDELGQILIAIKIDLGMMKQKVLKSIKTVDSENILTNFDSLFGLVDNTLNTTRKIMTDLRPEVLFLIGFIEAVKLYVKSFRERHQLICLFETNVAKLDLNSQQSVALYRIVQESLTNIAKHAKASRVDIFLDLDTDKLILKVKDNGVGFKTSQRNKPNSYGLLGMKERVYLLEGELLISSNPGEGTTIKVEIPYKK